MLLFSCIRSPKELQKRQSVKRSQDIKTERKYKREKDKINYTEIQKKKGDKSI